MAEEKSNAYNSDGQQLPKGTATDIIAEIQAYEKDYQKWENRAKAIVARYRDERSEATNARITTRKFNILWSNTETLKPTLYARLPRVQVERRFKDADPVGRTACEIAERAGNYILEVSPFDHVMRLAVQDLLLPGRGTVWINYRADFADTTQPMNSDESKDEPETSLDKIREMIEPIYVNWKDFGHTPARTWQEVKRAWRRTPMDRKQLIERFGAEKGSQLPLDSKANESSPKDKAPDSLRDTAWIYEVWDKVKRKVCWVHQSEKDYLDESDPPVELQDFWPFPRPLWAVQTNDSLIPVPLYTLYQDQAAELDKITNRIGRFTDGLKLTGTYDSSVPELARLLSPNGTPDNMLVGVANFGALKEKGGLAGAVSLLPVKEIADTLTSLYAAREQILNVIYQVTGIADIIRGSSDPKETATAQSIKGQFASLRIKDTQAEVARFARDAARIAVEIAVEMYEPETLYEMVQADQFTKLTPREQQQAQMQQQMAQQRAMFMRQPPQQLPPPKPTEEFALALKMLRDDKMRSFHVDIETDSTIAMDEQAEKQGVTEFVGAAASFFQAFGPLVQEMPALAPVAGEMLLYASRRFKAGRAVENSIEQFVKNMEQQASQPKPPPPELLKIQADVKAKEADTQRKEREGQMKLAQSAQEHQQDMQFKAAEHQQDIQAKREDQAMDMHMKQREQQFTMHAQAQDHQLAMRERQENAAFEREQARLMPVKKSA